MTAAWIAAASAVVIALTSAFLTYTTTRRLTRRSNQVMFVNRQPSELYGPLHALSRASNVSWFEFRKKYFADRKYFFDVTTPPTEEDINAWKYWVRNVFMPLNKRMFEAILAKTDLIDENVMPKCFIDFCAHVTGYEVTLARWEVGDYSDLISVINHPGSSFHKDIQLKYEELKRRQANLLGSAPSSRRRRVFRSLADPWSS